MPTCRSAGPAQAMPVAALGRVAARKIRAGSASAAVMWCAHAPIPKSNPPAAISESSAVPPGLLSRQWQVTRIAATRPEEVT